MVEIRLFIDIIPETKDKIRINAFIAELLDVSNGDNLEVFNPDNNKIKIANVEISDMVMDISAEISMNIAQELGFTGTELIIRNLTSVSPITKELSKTSETIVPEIRFNVNVNPNTRDIVVINPFAAEIFKLKNGDPVAVYNPYNNLAKVGIVQISNRIMDLVIEISENIARELLFAYNELILRKVEKQIPQIQPIPQIQRPSIPAVERIKYDPSMFSSLSDALMGGHTVVPHSRRGIPRDIRPVVDGSQYNLSRIGDRLVGGPQIATPISRESPIPPQPVSPEIIPPQKIEPYLPQKEIKPPVSRKDTSEQYISTKKFGIITFNLLLIILLSIFIHTIDQFQYMQIYLGVNILLVSIVFIPYFLIYREKDITAGCCLMIPLIIFIIIITSIFQYSGATFVIQYYIIIPIFLWINVVNHIVINGISVTDKSTKARLYVFKYDPQTEDMENLLVILAFIYLFGFLGFFLIGEFLQWNPVLNGIGRVVIGIFAFNMFFYATKFSRLATYLSILMGNLLLTMTIFVNFSIILEYNLFLNLLISNIGFLLLGGPVVTLKKKDPLRRILIFNWMFWTAYCGGGLILSIPQYDPGVYLEFFSKFIEVSVIVSTAYKYTEF